MVIGHKHVHWGCNNWSAKYIMQDRAVEDLIKEMWAQSNGTRGMWFLVSGKIW